MWHDPLMTVGSDTRIHELIEKAGGVNIIQDIEGYPTISLEAVIQANPQVIIVGSGMGEGADLPFEFASTELRLKDVDARINNRVYEINTDLVGRPGPRIIDGLEQLAEFLHPELFK
ncbi:Vitamin B12-binding protein [subsurface metagenome]